MKISEVYQSRFVCAADLQGAEVPVTIKAVKMEQMQTHDNKTAEKPVVYFVGKERGLVLNVTNARAIAALHGDDTKGWAGKTVVLYPTQIRAFGEPHDVIRVRAPDNPFDDK